VPERIEHEPLRYQFGPLERRGVLLGLQGGQLATLGGGGALALLALHAVSRPAGALLAAGLVLSAIPAALLPVDGRPLGAWLPLLAGYGLRRLRGRRRLRSQAHLAGHLVTVHAGIGVMEALPPEERPAHLRDLRILEIDAGREAPVGVIKDVRRHTYVGVLRVRGGSFNLLDPAGQAAAVQGWAAILAGYALASSPVSRLQWIERTLPDDSRQIARRFEERAAPDAPEAVLRIYGEAIAEARQANCRHECLLAIRVDARRAWRQVRQAGHGSLDRGACALLLRELASLGDQLDGAAIEVEEVLGPRAIAEVLRTAFVPEAAPRLRLIHGEAGDAGPHPRSAWPLETLEGLGHYRAGVRSLHATYHVREWPRIEVGPGFMASLLLDAASLRTVSLTLEPVAAARAARELRRALAGDVSDDSLRQRGGWLPSFRRQHEEENVLRAERELAEGQASYRFSGYVTVSAASVEELEASCAEVEQAAGRSHLELERLVAQQEIAFTYTLPLCEGLA
jgi:hypothetical protein